MRRQSSGVVGLAVVLALVGGCSAAPAPAPPPSSTTSSTSSTSTPTSAAPLSGDVYLSLGDSYATGYRPSDSGVAAGPSEDGFAYLVAQETGLDLVNLGCSGATSAELLDAGGCRPANQAIDAPDAAGQSQLDAAVEVLRSREVGLVTLVVGGNDLSPCAREADPLACATQAITDIQANLAAVLPVLREADPDVPIVGLTYPDVFLGAWVSPSFSDGENLAQLSVGLFRTFFNTTLAAEYDTVDADFADVTAATGGYTPLTETVDDPTYGTIPTAVAKVCSLTYFCSHTDVHPNADGHRVIADTVVAAVEG